METNTRTPAEIEARYELDYSWRAAWGKLASKLERGRLQLRQERIEHRAKLANNRIGRLMAEFDSLPRSMPQMPEAASQIPTISATALKVAVKSFKKALGRLEELESYSDAELLEHKNAIAFLRTLLEHPLVDDTGELGAVGMVAQFTKLRAERDEADRRAGAAERELEHSEAAFKSMTNWTATAREQAGFGRNTSFDIVWAQTLDKAKKYSALLEFPTKAWLVVSKTGLVRTAWTTQPSDDQLSVAHGDGDTVTALMAKPE